SFSDGAESSNVVWSIESSEPEVPASGRWQRVSLAPTEHLYRCSSSPLAASVSLVSPPLAVPPGEPFTLSFRHRHSFESGGGAHYDGGVIELSADGGTTWTDIGAPRALYGGALFADSGNPLGGREAFVADSPGYPEFTRVELDLGDQYGGRDVLVRFRVGSDAGTSSPGWDLDDISVSGVAEPPFDAVVPHSEACGDAPPDRKSVV